MKFNIGTLITAGLFLTIFIVGGTLWGIPHYKVFSAEQDGRATLARAEYSKKSQVQDAMAKLESAKYLADAANVIKSSLTPEYLQYLKIQMQEQVAERNGSAAYFFESGTQQKVTIPAKP
jgi:hypothetical protein